MCEHHTLGQSRRSTCRHDERVTVLDRLTSGQCVQLAVGRDDARRTKRFEHRSTGRLGQSGVEGGGGVAGVPDCSERIDEARSNRKVECDEFWHWR